jgi:hypothetical protein
MTVSQCINLYERLGKRIFGASKNWATATMFSSTALEKVLYEIIAEENNKRSPGDGRQTETVRLVDSADFQPKISCPM